MGRGEGKGMVWEGTDRNGNFLFQPLQFNKVFSVLDFVVAVDLCFRVE